MAASLTLSSLLFLTTKMFLGFVGQVSLKTRPAGLNSSAEGRAGTESGLRKGNVGVDVVEGGFWRRVGATRLGNSFVERRVDMGRRQGWRRRRARRRRSIWRRRCDETRGNGLRSAGGVFA